jgi:hypothetical protein
MIIALSPYASNQENEATRSGELFAPSMSAPSEHMSPREFILIGAKNLKLSESTQAGRSPSKYAVADADPRG